MMLARVMHLDGCHLCRSSPYPTAAMTMNAKTESIRSHFHGRIDITIHAASTKAKDVQLDKPDEEAITYSDIASHELFRVPPVSNFGPNTLH